LISGQVKITRRAAPSRVVECWVDDPGADNADITADHLGEDLLPRGAGGCRSRPRACGSRPEAPSTILLLASATSHTTAFGLIHPVGMTSCHPGRTF